MRMEGLKVKDIIKGRTEEKVGGSTITTFELTDDAKEGLTATRDPKQHDPDRFEEWTHCRWCEMLLWVVAFVIAVLVAHVMDTW